MSFDSKVIDYGNNIHALVRAIEESFNYTLIDDDYNYILGDFYMEFKNYGILIKHKNEDNFKNVGAIFENGYLYWNKDEHPLREKFHDLMCELQ